MASDPSNRGNGAPERFTPARVAAALSPCATQLRKSCLRVTRSLAARAFSRANSASGSSRVVRMRLG